MPVGAGQQLLSNVPPNPFDPDVRLFNELTQKTIFQAIKTRAYAGMASSESHELPHAGIISEIRIHLEGNIAGAAAGVEDPNWAYRLAKRIRLHGAGQTDLIACRGMDLHVLRFIKNPALNRNTEFYSTAPDENGNYRVTWVIPVAADPVSLVGSVWAQSQAQQLTLDIDWATLAELGLTGATVTGSLTIEETIFEVPYHPAKPGEILIPDLTMTHGIIDKTERFSATGDLDSMLVRKQATLMRLIAYVDLGSTAGVANPVDFTKASPEVETLGLEYGAVQRPQTYKPAWGLAERNSEHYGAPLPKGHVCFDQVKENGPRDVWILSGTTDPKLLYGVRSGTTLAAGSHVHIVQEVLYHGGR